ncbi:hypothetical protein [Mycolicibacterium neworleansense]|uniref:Uncharacterized protein n=1 Tax=Mycolicibacterium neworleansense TaxID=146018 RepID=A0A0H5S8H3_9MYCO|nr:hypothetical protein [Mycolicibacterium neworleansense]MCV7362846.1 hypothetical protein [Mycolicibacterium neworleansense]CRZ17589.1 hypothetical protein BN2156_04475 [Mycolicibacterium neworleansense]
MSETAAFGDRHGGQSPWGRVLGESSLLDFISAQVRGWAPLAPAEASWLTDTPVPAGWRALTIADDAATPLRVVGTTVEGRPGWAGLQALSAFRFTGVPDPAQLVTHADKSLRDWNAEGIRTSEIVLPKLPGLSGVRSSGYITLSNESLWVEYCTHLRGSAEPGKGLVVEQIFAAAAGTRMRLGPGIGALTTATSDAFIAHIGSTPDEVAAAVADHGEQLRREAAAGPVLSREQKRFLATALSVWGGIASGRPLPIEALGYTGRADFDADLARLRDQLGRDRPELSTRDWSRIQFLAEISWASDMFGAGVEFELVSPFTDPEALALLRSIQRALARTVDPALVFPRGDADGR